jgi:hypothetical protein
VRVLLPSVAFDATVARTSSRYLQGAWVSRPFHPEADGESRRFRDAFFARYRREPDFLSALAFDTFNLVRRASEGLPPTEAARDVVLARIAGDNAPTATSIAGFDGGRGPRVPTVVYELRGEVLVRP